MNQVVSQTDDTSATIIDGLDHRLCYNRWEAIFGIRTRPEPVAEPDIEQLSCLTKLLKQRVAPYADFAVCGPFSNRQQRKMRLQGSRFHIDGHITPIELLGPPDLAT